MPADEQARPDRQSLLRALEASPDDPALLLRLGILDLSAGRPDRAEEALRRAAAAAPSAEALEGLGAALNRLGRFGEALDPLRRAAELEPGRAAAWNSLGEALGNLGRNHSAAEAFARAIRAQPDFAAAHFNLGLTLRALGQAAPAMNALRQAIRIRPEFPEALHALGRMLHSSGNYAAAVECFRPLTRLRDRDPAAHTSLGAACQMLGDLEAARRCYERAVSLAPDYPDAHSNLGTVYQGLRQMEKAEASFRRALRIDPEHADALAGLATNLDRRGRYADGIELIRDRLPSPHTEMTVTGAQLLRHLGRSGEAADMLADALRGSGLTPSGKQRLHFIFGDVLDDLGRFEDAFEQYRAGNAAKPVRFNRDEHHSDVAQLLEVFPATGWEHLPRVDHPSDRPVFVLGMPRSGTSLVEQILACHPQVAGAGELTELGQAAIDLGRAQGDRFPASLRHATPAVLEAAAEAYLGRLERASTGALRVIDKTPANHLFIGFVQCLFPNARIIHCVRHPLDTALSNYFQNFAGQGIPFSYDLGDIAFYYNHYLRVMAHWRAHSGLAMHEVVYEEVVTDQETATRAMVDFLGLDWDPACLEFHRLDRVVATASHAQVRKPLYRSSIGRFRNYESHLGPLREALDWDAWRSSGFAERVDGCLPTRS
jgi:tetratricopeptide (TPR) repeat protein